MERQPRMIVSVEGMEGSGKSRFALTAPRPLWWLDFDFGLEGVDGADRVDVRHEFNVMAAEWMAPDAARRHMQETVRGFIEVFRDGIGKARTMVVDTFTAAWAAQRVGHPDDKYADLEQEFLGLLRLAYACPSTNVILIHHMKKDWKRTSDGKSYPAGTWSRDGMDGIANVVQLATRQRFVPPVPEQRAGEFVTQAAVAGRFETDILKCRDNIGLMGQTLPGMDFPTLCAMVAPTIDWSK